MKAQGSVYLCGMKMSGESYVDVLLPLALPTPLTYSVPVGMEVVEGARVVVPMRQSSRYVGVIWRIHREIPAVDLKRVRAVETVLDLSLIHI